jgi:RNA polymerase sigma-70 factor (ECF subfamily)
MSTQPLATAGTTIDEPCPATRRGRDVRPSFSTLVADHGDAIYRYCWHLTRNQADADDLYQETLLKAYRAHGKLDGDANHRAWLYKIASNTFISDRRKRGRESALSEAMAETVAAPAVDHADGLDARDLLHDVECSVLALPTKQRVALILRKYHDFSYTDIAVSLNTTEVAARANVHAALKKLRSQYANRLDGTGL